MNISRYLRQRTKVIVLTAAHLLITKASANAIDVTFGASVGEVHNVPATNDINTNTTANSSGLNGFNNFFSDDFLLLGAVPSATSISSDLYPVGPSVAISNSTEIIFDSQDVTKDIVLEYDWIFQGNSDGLLQSTTIEENLDLFTIALVGADVGNEIDIDVLIKNSYGSQRDATYTIPADTLLAGTYTINASLVEAVDLIPPLLADSSSAAGLGNVTINVVPFEFSPTLGLLAVGGFWGLSKLKLWQRLKK